jgi:hypothetical protein
MHFDIICHQILVSNISMRSSLRTVRASLPQPGPSHLMYSVFKPKSPISLSRKRSVRFFQSSSKRRFFAESGSLNLQLEWETLMYCRRPTFCTRVAAHKSAFKSTECRGSRAAAKTADFVSHMFAGARFHCCSSQSLAYVTAATDSFKDYLRTVTSDRAAVFNHECFVSIRFFLS